MVNTDINHLKVFLMENKEQYEFPNRQEYIKALDSVLPDNYIMTRKLGGSRTAKYLPIPIQESMADKMFQEWNVIDEKYEILVNEVICTVKIAYTPAYPGANEQFCTGSGCIPIQMEKGSSVKDFPTKKIQNAMEYNVPSAKKRAIGNALEGLGNIFGRNIGRKLDKNTELPSNFKIRKHD